MSPMFSPQFLSLIPTSKHFWAVWLPIAAAAEEFLLPTWASSQTGWLTYLASNQPKNPQNHEVSNKKSEKKLMEKFTTMLERTFLRLLKISLISDSKTVGFQRLSISQGARPQMWPPKTGEGHQRWCQHLACYVYTHIVSYCLYLSQPQLQ